MTTQTKYPWRTTLRSVLQFTVGLAALAPFIVAAINDGNTEAATGLTAGVLAVSGAVTRLMALPKVNDFLARWAPWLAAEGSNRVDV